MPPARTRVVHRADATSRHAVSDTRVLRRTPAVAGRPVALCDQGVLMAGISALAKASDQM